MFGKFENILQIFQEKRESVKRIARAFYSNMYSGFGSFYFPMMPIYWNYTTPTNVTSLNDTVHQSGSSYFVSVQANPDNVKKGVNYTVKAFTSANAPIKVNFLNEDQGLPSTFDDTTKQSDKNSLPTGLNSEPSTE